MGSRRVIERGWRLTGRKILVFLLEIFGPVILSDSRSQNIFKCPAVKTLLSKISESSDFIIFYQRDVDFLKILVTENCHQNV
ncbi:unnamed protein product [Moneuplotes crassus]|uniref:Uncharacterized protein n=1 Tax=Euplotes crassus TaxID=5936 RepID=A0AAD1XPK2_EUPCR|nr:unnamed protein product [Moneuplotes crassus]